MPESTVTAVREHVVQLLRDGGLDVGTTDDEIVVTIGDWDCDVVVSQHVVPGSGRVTCRLASGTGDDMRVHIAVFVDATGSETGTALVISEATLDDTVKATAGGWQANVEPTVSSGNPQSALDVCVAPMAEIADWLKAELVDWVDDEDDDAE